MSLLYRLKGRVETDLLDLELEAMIDAEVAEIVARFGAIASTVFNEIGARQYLTMHNPINEALSVAVVEIDPRQTGAAANRTTLAADDYRILDGGRTLERLIDGTNGRREWAPEVELTYTPKSNQTERDEAVIRLVQLAITYRGLDKQEAVGDHSRGGPVTADAYPREREALLNSLAPRGRLVMA